MIRKSPSSPPELYSNPLVRSLSAVDMHTAQHLVKNALSGPLASNRTLIIVTHHITLCLPHASYLVELSDGQTIRQGSVRDLEAQGQLKELGAADNVIEEKALEDEVEHEVESNDIVAEEIGVKAAPGGKPIGTETCTEGRVALSTYTSYIKAAGSKAWIIIVLLMVFIRCINIGHQVRDLSIDTTSDV